MSKEAKAQSVLKLALEALEGIHPGNMTPMAEDSSLTEQDVDRFCDANCTWSDHHPDCKYGTQEQFKKEVKHD